MKKKDYKKPTMRVVEIQQSHIICNSPPYDPGYGGGL